MDLEDFAALGFLFGGFELLETLATVVVALVVLAVLVGAVLLWSRRWGRCWRWSAWRPGRPSAAASSG